MPFPLSESILVLQSRSWYYRVDSGTTESIPVLQRRFLSRFHRVDRELDRKKIAAVYRISPCASDEVGGGRQIFGARRQIMAPESFWRPPQGLKKIKK